MLQFCFFSKLPFLDSTHSFQLYASLFHIATKPWLIAVEDLEVTTSDYGEASMVVARRKTVAGEGHAGTRERGCGYLFYTTTPRFKYV
jgi:hypothetical protein